MMYKYMRAVPFMAAGGRRVFSEILIYKGRYILIFILYFLIFHYILLLLISNPRRESWIFPGRHQSRVEWLPGPLDPAGPHAQAVSDDRVCGRACGHPRTLGGLLLQLALRTQSGAGS